MPAVPQYFPSQRELDDLELLLTGALAPRVGFDTTGPITLVLPDEVAVAAREAGGVELTDAEGMPLARVDTDGTAHALAAHVTGPFRRLYRAPQQVRQDHADALFAALAAPPSEDDLAEVQQAREGREVVLVALVGDGTPRGVGPVGLLRAALIAARILGDAHVVAVPLASHGDAALDAQLTAQVLEAYAGGQPLLLTGEGPLPADVEDVVAQDHPPREEQGLVVFFTGLSGSGKSTLARELHDLLLEDGRRTVTSLDGDVVRRNLSAGLGFSREDRETNIRRIGWVAAEISRHRGVAICSPIAPFEQTRSQVRADVERAGGAFFLVHVATPLAECERRDKKGLYAKARAGQIPEFTGISSPYEEPHDADVRVDTTGRSVAEALADVLGALATAGYLDLREDRDD
ncbi:adenylyl-sulfate kinase [Nocardioides mangrovicus]|uniref:adenylyl-sulfate kinase n=1 Tax=Nocardioides mangrovicus TaxID=2478913 RepID=A0A3L8P1Q7_9ACTN|nr:adenylyl-sulfate kinase [Nocardioides mangrovicus]RLV48358.1 adenylyl-sulfate kinase [Nocardioides mangrovicus]